jgi:hypothetical protein
MYGGAELQFHALITSEPDADEWSALSSGKQLPVHAAYKAG